MNNLKKIILSASLIFFVISIPLFVTNDVDAVTDVPEGALIRAIGDIDVYIVKYVGVKKFKRLILSPAVFNSYGHLRWEDIMDVDQSVVDAFITSNLVRATVAGDPKVFILYPAGDIGEKRWIETANIFLAWSFDWDSVFTINEVDRDSYLAGSSLESEPTSGGDIVFTPPPISLVATVGDEYKYSFCKPDLLITTDLCGGPFRTTTNPTGGQPPYTFQLDTMGGFPPFGIILNLNGLLTGTPTAEGERTFRVCAIDQVKSQSCQTVSLNVTAEPVSTNLTVTWSGSGNGTVSWDTSADETDCGYDAAEVYKCVVPMSPDSIVTLTNEPTVGSSFTGWSGACSGMGACVITMDDDKEVTAGFIAHITFLTIHWSGTGDGTVSWGTSFSEGDCGDDDYGVYRCLIPMLRDSIVTLTNEPSVGSTFTGWSGSCSGTGACVFAMNDDEEVTASFALQSDQNGGQDDPGDTTTPAVSIQSGTCVVRERFSWGTPISFTISLSGSASGPVGAWLELHTTDLGMDCGAWGNNCQRDAGEDESTSWNSQGNGAAGLQAFEQVEVCTTGCVNDSMIVPCPIN